MGSGVCYFAAQQKDGLGLPRYEFLEQELREMLRDAPTGPRRVDKVVKVHTLTGKPLYFVLHVEIQVQRESNFPQRMLLPEPKNSLIHLDIP